AGTFFIGLTFAISTVVTEVYGFKRSRRALWRTIFIAFMFCGLAGWAARLPVAEGLVVLSSLIAFTIGGFTNVIRLESSYRRHSDRFARKAIAFRIVEAGALGLAADSIIFFPASFWHSRWHGAGMVALGFLVKMAVLCLMLPVLKKTIAYLQTEED